ncbi:hypothetical protein INS49_007688 [Diaporthe citri]|uniref:uncharacterized protein n=1 Tax=Diaporthe citri TaxID=83186 RepID=UPI001C8020BE|nr:uncharacterized protein INS49_007688 [Diaporthe citri]KAG6362596.1 hypothetical protein INS49_007688 [Diaporthe citri]
MIQPIFDKISVSETSNTPILKDSTDPMIVQKSCHPRHPERVVITPTTSLQLFLEMDIRLKTHAQNPNASTTKSITNQQATRKQKAIVICGFAAIGKSTFKAACDKAYDGDRVIDLDSSLFPKGPTWPNNYLEAIRERLSEKCILMISTHKDIYSRLLEEGVALILVYPKRELRAEWLERIRKREADAGSDAAASICGVVNDRWDGWVSEYGEQRGCLKYEMSEGEYLQGAVHEVVDHFHEGFSSSKNDKYELVED